MLSLCRRILGKFYRKETRALAVRGYTQVAVGWLRFGWHLSRWWEPITFTAYVPDSIWVRQLHGDLRPLLRKWSSRNQRNNAGDLGRFYALVLNLRQLGKMHIAGDYAELGVYRGNSAAVLAEFAAKEGRRVFLFDTFGGFDKRDLLGVDDRDDFHGWFSDTSLPAVRRLVGHPEHCTFVQGYFPDSINAECDRAYAFVHIDCDLYMPMGSALEYFYPRLTPGGCLFLHDYGSGTWDGATRAIDEFCARTGESVVLLADKSGTAIIRKKRPDCPSRA